MNQSLALVGGRVVTPHETIESGTVLIRGQQIAKVGHSESIALPAHAKVIDVTGRIICPGFVELHIHGGHGINLGSVSTSPASLTGTVRGDTLQVARELPATGITSFLPTLLGSTTFDGLLDSIREVASAMDEPTDGAQILGIHMEGPYLNPAPKGRYDRWPPGGVIPPELARRPSLQELGAMIESSEGHLRMMSVSPEIEGALDLIREVVRQGIVASGAHSFATYEETLTAIEAGMRTVTHLYNGMRHQDHRDPGIIEASLACDHVVGQIIADGIHVHPPALEVAIRCKGISNLAVTTDNTAYAGMPNGTYVDFVGRTVIKTDDVATVGEGRLFGSVMPMNRQLFTLVNRLRLTPGEAIQMATVVPARLIGLLDSKGSLEPGKDADVTVLDEQFNVALTLCRGVEAYRQSEEFAL